MVCRTTIICKEQSCIILRIRTPTICKEQSYIILRNIPTPTGHPGHTPNSSSSFYYYLPCLWKETNSITKLVDKATSGANTGPSPRNAKSSRWSSPKSVASTPFKGAISELATKGFIMLPTTMRHIKVFYITSGKAQPSCVSSLWEEGRISGVNATTETDTT